MQETPFVDDANSIAPRPVLSYERPMASTVGIVGCRVLAIWLLVTGINSTIGSVAQFVTYFQQYRRLQYAEDFYLAFPLVFSLFWIGLAWFCWKKAPYLATRMVPLDESTSASGVQPNEMLCIALIAVGVYTLTEALPILTWLIYAFSQSRTTRPGVTQTVDFGRLLIPALMRLVIGIWLILGNGGIAAFIRRHGGKWRES